MPSRSAEPDPPLSRLPRSSEPNHPETDLGDTVLVGRVLRPHGVRGEVKVEVWSDVDDRFAVGAELRASVGGAERRLSIAASRPMRGLALVRFAGIDDREAAAELRGAELSVDTSQVPPAPPGCYYHFDLEGCRCHDVEHGDLGTVTAVLEDGGGSLLEVTAGDRQLLVPFVDAFLRVVDVDGQRIDLQLPEGLLETCVSKS